jgi:hypothetical protein
MASRRGRLLRGIGCYLLLGVVITVAWCSVYGRWSAAAWATPLVYDGDGLTALATAKAIATGEIVPFLPKYPASLGAPFVANWNDYPTSEEGILAWLGLLARIFGPFSGSNLTILSAHLLAAFTFYWVCRYLRYDRFLSLAGAGLFALSRYSFLRSLPHFTLTFYWHIPLGLLAVWWCLARSAPLKNRNKVVACIAIAILLGVQSPYYAWLFGQFFLLAALVWLFRPGSKKAAVLPIMSAAVLFATFVLMNADTFYCRWVQGPNVAAISARSYADLERYALKAVDLVVPLTHPIQAIQNWGVHKYFSQALFLGEIGAPYLGLVAIASLVALIAQIVKAIARRDLGRLPSHFWLILWIFAYSSVGGIGSFLGMFGLILFRATNRFSIVVLALLLFFLAREATRLTKQWRWPWRLMLAVVILAVGLWDQLPTPYSSESIAVTRWQVQADRTLVSKMEKSLPKGAMVFQLPVVDFPEAPAVERMTDYEQLRPYLHSHWLRFSYGSDKGRPRERWQKEAEQSGAQSLVKTAERYGFSCLLINRFGYQDSAASFLENLRAIDRGDVIAESYKFVCVRLRPVANPELPPIVERLVNADK